jgi:hypothetical protein
MRKPPARGLREQRGPKRGVSSRFLALGDDDPDHEPLDPGRPGACGRRLLSAVSRRYQKKRLALPLALSMAAGVTLGACTQERARAGEGGPGQVVGTPGMFTGIDTGVTSAPIKNRLRPCCYSIWWLIA